MLKLPNIMIGSGPELSMDYNDSKAELSATISLENSSSKNQSASQRLLHLLNNPGISFSKRSLTRLKVLQDGTPLIDRSRLTKS